MCIFCFCNSEYKGFIFIKLFVAIIFSLKDWLSNHEIKEILLFIVFPEATSCAQNCSKFFSPVCSYLLCCLWILFYWHIYTHWLKFWSSWVLISHLKCGFMSFQEKNAPNFFLQGLSFICCRWNVYRKVPWFQKLPCPEKFLVMRQVRVVSLFSFPFHGLSYQFINCWKAGLLQNASVIPIKENVFLW